MYTSEVGTGDDGLYPMAVIRNSSVNAKFAFLSTSLAKGSYSVYVPVEGK